MQFLEAASECKVAAAVVFPSDIQNPYAGVYGTRTTLGEGTFLRLKREIEAKAEIPVYLLGDMVQMNEMTDVILGYLS